MQRRQRQFEQLYKSNYRQMYRLAYAFLADADDARDVVAQVFAQLWHSRTELKNVFVKPDEQHGAFPDVAMPGGRRTKSKQQENDAITSYLLTATRNQCYHILHARIQREELEQDLRHSTDANTVDAERELIEELREIINDSLTPRDRQILSLHYDEGLSYKQTADALGISLAAVNKHITLSIAKLRKRLTIDN
ncbi:MAG: sigma-70 family RNA polymerase sigma factor [Bacteroidaceae bacterium]|nr:sigma-70 family RNA polymerase sigma factor [Bacteroidaceae bacterium]